MILVLLTMLISYFVNNMEEITKLDATELVDTEPEVEEHGVEVIQNTIR